MITSLTKMMTLAALVAVTLSPSGARANAVAVDQEDQAFLPEAVSIKKGDVVVWHNKEEDTTHNIIVIAADGTKENLGTQATGVDLQKKFDKEGDYAIRCAIHPKMKMTISVK